MEPALTRSLVVCVASILKAQEISNEVWESGLVRKAFAMLLSISFQDSGSVRRTLQEELRSILESHFNQGFSVTSHYLLRQLEALCKSFDGDDYHELLNYLLVFSHIVTYLHSDFMSPLFSSLLQVRDSIFLFPLVPTTLWTSFRLRSVTSLRCSSQQRSLRGRRSLIAALLAAPSSPDPRYSFWEGHSGVCSSDVWLCSLLSQTTQRGAAGGRDSRSCRLLRFSGRGCTQVHLAVSHRLSRVPESGRRIRRDHPLRASAR